MTTIFKATTERFQQMFELLTMSKMGEPLFNPIAIKIVEEKGKEPYLQMKATNVTNTAATIQKHRNIEIQQYDNPKDQIAVDGIEILQALTIFNKDNEIEIEFGENDITIRDIDMVEISDTVKMPMIDPDYVSSRELPIKVNNGMPVINDNVVKFDINVTIPVDFIKAQIKRANYVNVSPRLFSMDFNDNELKLMVGDDTEAFTKSVKSTVTIDGKGSGNCTYGDGYEQIFGSLFGEVLFMSTTGQPCWITQKEDDYIVQFMLAPAFRDSDERPQ